VRWLSGVVIVLGGLLNMGVFLRVGGEFLVVTCGLDPGRLEVTMNILLVGVAVYTIMGGMLSVLIIDFLQFVVMSIGLIAVTSAPGLIGALLVGVSAAKAMAYSLGIPFIGVHHGEAHILAAHLDNPGLGYPYIALLASGGHTALYHVRELGSYRLLGQTRDDAAGEAFDKVAKLLDLPYPGGPVIDRLAQEGDAQAVHFPRGKREGYDFSFSGLKTAVRNRVALFRSKDAGLDPKLNVKDIAASFQAAAVDMLVDKTIRAAAEHGADTVVVAGGVAANSSLRKEMRHACEKSGVTLILPGMELCVDNAAMVALAGYLHYQRGDRSELDLNPRAGMTL